MGGWDGHYLYADPNHNHLYITTVCTPGKGNWLGLVLMTRDNGANWSVFRHVQDNFFWREPVLALSNGLVGFAYRANNKAIVQTFRFPGLAPNDPATLQEVAPLSYPPDTPQEKYIDRVGLNASVADYLSLARVEKQPRGGRPKLAFLLAAYRNQNMAVAYDLYEYEPGKAAKLFATVEAEKAGNSILQGTFVEAADMNAPSIFYWLEQVEKGKFRTRFQIFSKGKRLGATQTISQDFTTSSFTGDYLDGTSYKTSDGWEFFLSWSESGRLKVAQVFVPSAPTTKGPLVISVPSPLAAVSPVVVPAAAASEVARQSGAN